MSGIQYKDYTFKDVELFMTQEDYDWYKTTDSKIIKYDDKTVGFLHDHFDGEIRFMGFDVFENIDKCFIELVRETKRMLEEIDDGKTPIATCVPKLEDQSMFDMRQRWLKYLGFKMLDNTVHEDEITYVYMGRDA